MTKVSVLKPYEEILVDGEKILVKRIIQITDTHIIVEHIDGSIEAIPIERTVEKPKTARKPQPVLV